MFLFLNISFFCVYFPVDLEVFYLGHVKKPLYNTIQYNTIQYNTILWHTKISKYFIILILRLRSLQQMLLNPMKRHVDRPTVVVSKFDIRLSIGDGVGLM